MKKENTTTEAVKDTAPQKEKKTTVRKATTKTTTARKTTTKKLSEKKSATKTSKNAEARKLSPRKVMRKGENIQADNEEVVTMTEAQMQDVAFEQTESSAGTVVAEHTVSPEPTAIESEKQETEVMTTEAEATEVNGTDINPETILPTEAKSSPVNDRRQKPERQEQKILPLPQMEIHDIVELSQAPQRAIVLTDQQIQQLTLEEIQQRHSFLQHTLANVLDYDVVISDTNIWLELLLGHTSSHSDPRYNARLQFERQLEFISKLTKYRGGRFMMLSETYEEIDRFATMQDPTDYRDADFTDNLVCLNAAARLAKRLILSQQRENRLRIDNIGAESHHASFADPAIIRCVADLFAAGKKVLILTNDASVAIRSIGICDDLQRHNNISDEVWNEKYVPIRPMVFTFDDLKLLDYYTRQYHYIQMASGQPWMNEISRSMNRIKPESLSLWLDAFRPGDKHRTDNLFSEPTEQDKQQNTVVRQNRQQKQKPQQQSKQKQEKQQPRLEQPQQPRQETQVLTAVEVTQEVKAEPTARQEVQNDQHTLPTPVAEVNTTEPQQKPKRQQRRKPAVRRKPATKTGKNTADNAE